MLTDKSANKDDDKSSFWSSLFGRSDDAVAADETCKINIPKPEKEQPFVQVLYLTDRVEPPCDQVIDTPFIADAINVRADGQCIRNNTIKDVVLETEQSKTMKLAEKAHRDAIQLIPYQRETPNYQFMAGELCDVVIENNHIHSEGMLQGVFASDGLFRNLTVQNNVICTQSQHKVSINGLLSGQIGGNWDENSVPVPVYLGPVRLGGNLMTGNVWVLSFAESDEYQYAPLQDVMLDKDRVGKGLDYPHVTDARSIPQNRSGKIGDTNLTHFPMTLFKEQLSTTTLSDLLAQEKRLADDTVAWIGRLFNALPEKHIEAITEAYQCEREVPLVQLQNQALRNFTLQALAKAC